MRAFPWELWEVISVTAAIFARCRSKGAVTLVAITSGLAPGICAWTMIVGKSTCGSGETESLGKAKMPAAAMPAVNKLVATGRATKIPKKIIWQGGTPTRPRLQMLTSDPPDEQELVPTRVLPLPSSSWRHCPFGTWMADRQCNY